MSAYPATARPLNELAERLLCTDTPALTRGEREMIAGYVSYLNECVFCSETHGAAANHHHQKSDLSREVWGDPEAAAISDRLKSYLRIAAKVQNAPRTVSESDIQNAREWGATDADIHDIVLTAAAFCMYNRYVDGLQTFAPPRKDPAYAAAGAKLAKYGYIHAGKSLER